MSKDLSADWLTDDEVIEDEEVVFGGNSESPYIQGYSAQDVKITMAKRIVFDKSKVEFIELDFANKNGKTLTEKYMLRGKDGKPFYIDKRTKAKKAHFGVSKIKSLLKVLGLYHGSDNVMKDLFSATEEADVTYTEYGKEKTEEFTVFNDLLEKKVKICVTSKKVNATTSSDQDEPSDQKYVDQCIKDTKAFVESNPKKKSLAKFAKPTDYPNVYKWFTETSVAHFCSLDGFFGGEMDAQEGGNLQDFLDANEDGTIFDGRTLICDEFTDSQLKKLSINVYGKRVEAESDDGYEEPTEEEEEVEEDWN